MEHDRESIGETVNTVIKFEWANEDTYLGDKEEELIRGMKTEFQKVEAATRGKRLGKNEC